KIGVGTVNVGSNTVIGAGATLIVNGNLTLANALAGGTGAAATSGTLNITNGTVLANNIVAGTNSSTSTIGVYGGMLAVSNAIGDAAAPLGTLTLAPLGTPDNSRTTLQLAADATTAVTVNTLNLDGLDTT